MSTRIGPYRVLRLINEGGQGGVYLGYDSRLQRRVAIKVYRFPEGGFGRKQLLDEAKLVVSIDTHKIVQIYDLVVGQDNLALIMEYIPGCDLEEFLSERQPSVSTVLTVATDLAGALAAARQQDIVHGDLKAANVLVTDSGRIKLTDFGIARAGNGHSVGLQGAGSPSSVSPEQFLGKSLDIRSDLFALGCLIYRMLTGIQPFFRDGQLDPHSLLETMPAPVETLVPDLPLGLPELLVGLLQKDPNDRPGDTQQLRYALRRITRAMPLSVSSSLLDEARPFFREESAGDVPPIIPADLLHAGRSRLRGLQMDAAWPERLAGAKRLLWLLLPLVAMAVFLLLPVTPAETRIHIDTPTIQLDAGVSLPHELTPVWFVEQLQSAASAELGPVIVSGPVGATQVRTLYASPKELLAQEQAGLALRCTSALCLLTVTREGEQGIRTQQLVLFPDDTAQEWGEAVQGVARVLYRQ
ncbi:MAG: serine/threonine-protein kinase [Halioglobus sp.]